MDTPSYRVIAMQNYGPSGSLFMQSLLDGHPRILAIPAVFMLDFYYFWRRYGHLPSPVLVDRFVQLHDDWFHPNRYAASLGLTQMGDSMDEWVGVSLDTFRHELMQCLKQSKLIKRRDFMLAVYQAYALTCGRSVEFADYILYPAHSQHVENIRQLMEDFPETYFLHMIRDPIQSVGSEIKHILHERLPVNATECALSQVLNDYCKHWSHVGRIAHGDRPYAPELACVSRGIRLEDLHKRPRDVMEAVCHWLRLPWDECLLKSTFNGKLWWSRPESLRVSGFSTAIVAQRHDQHLWDFDKFRLTCVAWRKLDRWQYPVLTGAKSIVWQLLMPLLLWCPLKAELKYLPRRLRDTIVEFPHRVVRFISSRPIAGKDVKDRWPWISAALQRSCWLISAVIVVLSPVYVIRDYVAIRFWLFRAWLLNLLPGSPEVELLPIPKSSQPA